MRNNFSAVSLRLESSNCINEYEKVIFVTLRLSGHRVSLLNQPAKTVGINYACMDTTARPGDDFAKYATGHWADLNPHPLEYPMWGTVTKVSDENVKALAGLIKDIADHGGLNVAYDAFGIQPTDSLYVKPEDRVRIW